MTKVYAWHFTNGMKYRDGTDLVVGQPCPHIENIELCKSGYHASENILDALSYASGHFLSRTEHSGKILRKYDKLCSQDRTPLWTIDATDVLIRFAQACADSAAIAASNAALYSSYAASYAARDAARHAAYYASHAASYASRAASYAAYYASNAALYSSHAASYASHAASYASHAASYASNAAYYAAIDGGYDSDTECVWQNVVLLQMVSDEYDRLCEAHND